MHIGVVLLVFGVMFVAELPDKSLFASLILGSKFPGLYVWAGAAAAFLVHVTIAVTAGHFLTLLPHTLLELIISFLFLAGAALVFFGKHGLEEQSEEKHKLKAAEAHSFWKIFGTSFGVVFIGEWGDITQIATANYAAKYHDPFSVAIGAVLGLWAVTAFAIIVGKKALTLVPPKVLQRITGTVLLAFGLYTLFSLIV